jgi:hypothetical protein
MSLVTDAVAAIAGREGLDVAARVNGPYPGGLVSRRVDDHPERSGGYRQGSPWLGCPVVAGVAA